VADSTVKSVIEGGQCTRVSINNCDWEYCDIYEQSLHSKLVRLTISGCKFRDTRSFVSAVRWAIMSCDRVQLWFLNMKHTWWRKLAEAIQNERTIEELHIYNCTPPMAYKEQMKIVKSGLILFIDGIAITAPSQQSPATSKSSLPNVDNYICKPKTANRQLCAIRYTMAIIAVVVAVILYFYFKQTP